MTELLLDVGREAVTIGVAVFVMMGLTELANVGLRGRLYSLLEGGKLRCYVAAAILGAIPGCAGGFLAIALYGHGALSLGAMVTAMVATMGDEAFILISRDPGLALRLTVAMSGVAMIVGALTDLAATKLGLATVRKCEVPTYHPGHEGMGHFFRVHLFRHILLKHLPRVLLWTVPALFLAEFINKVMGGEPVPWPDSLLVISGAIWGLIPSSGPHAIWVTMSLSGLVPWAALVANALSQSGHDILPLFAVAWRDALVVKLIALLTGIVVGLVILMLLG